MQMIIVGPLAPDQILEDIAQRPSASDACHSDDNSRRQVQDVRADSSGHCLTSAMQSNRHDGTPELGFTPAQAVQRRAEIPCYRVKGAG